MSIFEFKSTFPLQKKNEKYLNYENEMDECLNGPPTQIKVSIARVDNEKVHQCADSFGSGSPVDYRRQFEEGINKGLVGLDFFKDFPTVSFVDLSSVEEQALPKVMLLPKSVIRKKFSKTIDSRSWMQGLFRDLEGSW